MARCVLVCESERGLFGLPNILNLVPALQVAVPVFELLLLNGVLPWFPSLLKLESEFSTPDCVCGACEKVTDLFGSFDCPEVSRAVCARIIEGVPLPKS